MVRLHRHTVVFGEGPKAKPSTRITCGGRSGGRWVDHLEQRGGALRMSRLDVVHEAGAIADLLVKNNDPAVIFEQLAAEETSATGDEPL